MRNLSKETDSQSPLAAEPWLTTLVEAIKKEDHAVAEREYQAVRRAELIAQNGPVFWRKFTDTLEVLFRQMEDLFGNHVTKGKISFTRSPYGGGITINKSAYPFVSFSATPNFSETTAHFTYTVVNPEIPQNIGVPGRFLPCRFGVEGDQVVMSLDGTMFTTPEAAAKFIMEKLFTIATSAPVIIHEPEPVATRTEQNPLSEYAWPRVRVKPAFPVFDDMPAAVSEAKAEAEPAALLTETESPAVAAAAEEVPVVAATVPPVVETVPPVVETVAPPVEPEPVKAATPVSLVPPPLPFSAVRIPLPSSNGRAPLSKFFASATRLLGGGSAASSKSLMTALTAPAPVVTVQAPPAAVETPVVAAESPVVEAALEPSVAAEAVHAVSEHAVSENEISENEAVVTPPVEVENIVAEETKESIAAAECAAVECGEARGEEPMEAVEVAESPEPISTLESEPSPRLISISASRSASRDQRRKVRPQVIRTRFRYQDPRRHLPVQTVPAPAAVRPEARPVQVRQAAAGD
jgi:hypothetical protein